ncbi:MAG TPA: hypothetical protein VEJ37_11205 [Xanthobacteraceae bacterium]|nr:hypothetical protein [Xanthobacteraceae bacterium]
MKQLAFGLGLLALGSAAAAPARADFAVVKFETGYCQIWWDSAANPWGPRWTKIAAGLPNYATAWAVLANAVAQRVCP